MQLLLSYLDCGLEMVFFPLELVVVSFIIDSIFYVSRYVEYTIYDFIESTMQLSVSLYLLRVYWEKSIATWQTPCNCCTVLITTEAGSVNNVVLYEVAMYVSVTAITDRVHITVFWH